MGASGPWADSTRRQRLPDDWSRIRIQALNRDGWLCRWVRADTGNECLLAATDVDHIVPGDNHELSNLQALCAHHHARKSAREGARARNENRPKRERNPVFSPRQALLEAQRNREG
jgi:5-methylcytosine-specific restriction protein A